MESQNRKGPFPRANSLSLERFDPSVNLSLARLADPAQIVGRSQSTRVVQLSNSRFELGGDNSALKRDEMSAALTP
jgi:hypothetical protein